MRGADETAVCPDLLVIRDSPALAGGGVSGG
jgi:hypothetical protein